MYLSSVFHSLFFLNAITLARNAPLFRDPGQEKHRSLPLTILLLQGSATHLMLRPAQSCWKAGFPEPPGIEIPQRVFLSLSMFPPRACRCCYPESKNKQGYYLHLRCVFIRPFWECGSCASLSISSFLTISSRVRLI